MRKNLVITGIILVAFFWAALCARIAQSMSDSGPACSRRDCVPVEDLNLTGEQRAAIERVDQDYSNQIIMVRNELMSKRFELQFLLRDPQVNEEMIHAKGRKISELQDRYLTLMIDHQIKIRAVLSPEQVQSWCATHDFVH
jgi:Spy/CpxP family protein refolding chaperone